MSQTVYDEISEVIKRAETDFAQYVNDTEGNIGDTDHHSHVVSYLSGWAQGRFGEQRAQFEQRLADVRDEFEKTTRTLRLVAESNGRLSRGNARAMWDQMRRADRYRTAWISARRRRARARGERVG